MARETMQNMCVSVTAPSNSQIELTEEQGKADGHNNFSGESKLPTRQFIPKDNQSFRPDIKSEIQAIAEDFMEE